MRGTPSRPVQLLGAGSVRLLLVLTRLGCSAGGLWVQGKPGVVAAAWGAAAGSSRWARVVGWSGVGCKEARPFGWGSEADGYGERFVWVRPTPGLAAV